MDNFIIYHHHRNYSHINKVTTTNFEVQQYYHHSVGRETFENTQFKGFFYWNSIIMLTEIWYFEKCLCKSYQLHQNGSRLHPIKKHIKHISLFGTSFHIYHHLSWLILNCMLSLFNDYCRSLNLQDTTVNNFWLL